MTFLKKISTLLSEGDRLESQCQYREAEIAYRKVLECKPDFLQLGLTGFKQALNALAGVSNRLGILLEKQGRFNEAIAANLQAVRQCPENLHYWSDFAYILRFAVIHDSTPELKNAIITGLSKKGVNHQYFANAGISIVKQIPAFQEILNDKNNQLDSLLKKDTLFDTLSDPLFLLLLKETILHDPAVEALLTKVRRHLLVNCLDAIPNKAKKFLHALAVQCSLNEHVYSVEETEIQHLNQLKNKVSSLLESSSEEAKTLIELLACYLTVDKHPKEKSISHHIDSLSDISDEISQKVGKMYEEHPYPRWTTFNVVPPTMGKRYDLEPIKNALIAGCGTGQQALNCAVRHPEASVLAIDLSLASLSYAQRMAEEFHISNITFLQADILDLEKIKESFDLIECVGVLHHMQDPKNGLQLLNKKLNPNGIMNLGLYSELGRRDITAAKAFIKKMGWKATPEGIRECRQAILALDDSNPIKKVSQSLDFYSMSTCRDLLFHVHEKYFTLPEIENYLKELKLKFLGFDLPNDTILNQYRAQFPEDPQGLSLNNWNTFEQRHPDSFIGMYQFWIKKC